MEKSECQHLCRVCLRRDGELKSIFIREDNPLKLSDMIGSFTTLEIVFGDGLPEEICSSCANDTIQMYNFKLQCERSDHILRERLKKYHENANLEEQPSPSQNEVKLYHEVPTLDDFGTFDIKPFTEGIFAEKLQVADDDSDDVDDDVTEESSQEQYQCDVCNKDFPRNELLLRHKIYHAIQVEDKREVENDPGIKEEDTVLSCMECDEAFLQKDDLDKHFNEMHCKDKELVCEFCSKIFTKLSHKSRHLKTAHIDKQFKCPTCNKLFARKDQFNYHMNVHTGLKPHVCDICFKGFNQISNLKDHLRTHNGEKPFLCSTCGKGFNQLGNLRQHTVRHSGVKAHLCSTCGNGFASKGELTAHLRKHTGARPFVCHVCNHGFTTSSSLTKHKRIHSGEKPYECDTCKMKFSRSGILARHKRTHTGVKPYKCNFCTKAFSQSNDLTSHLRIHTGEKPYTCDECGHSFRQSSALKTHKKIHLERSSKVVEVKPILLNGFLHGVL